MPLLALMFTQTAAASLNQFKQIVGQVELSEDACGTNTPACTVEILKPSAAATVREADLFCATTGQRGYVPQNDDVTLNGAPVIWDATVPSSISSFNARDDVTAIVKPVGDVALPGLVVFTIRENPTPSYDGCILKVIWDDPTTTTNSILIFWGAQSTTGDTFVINFSQPLDASSFTAPLEFSLGISFGAQGCETGQFSLVDVNTVRLTSSAGGEDDGSCTDGALITVGGTGDSATNPPPLAPPTANPSIPDDELYDLRPFLTVGATSMTVFTRNPSNNDNIFIANFFLRNVFVEPPPPAVLVLEPETDTNTVGEEHCVTATVTDADGDPTPGITVRFSVSGANSAGGSAVTDANGLATFCYTGTVAGTDTITAYADTNNNAVQDPGEPGDTATKIYVAGPPATLLLTPPTDTNTAGDTHCVTATVRDQFGNPVPGVVVNFTVSGANTNGGPGTTDANGQAQFCYIGTVAGDDTITATAVGGSNPSATAQKTWEPGDPASLVLTPATDTNTVDDEHCVTATVEDALGNPTPGITVRFSVTGSVTTSGSDVTDAAGQAEFCYTGPGLPGADVITAYADTNNDSVRQPNEPQGTAAKTWGIPASTEGCKVTYGGRITAANGDKATFGGNAKADGLTGQEEYQDHGPAADINVHSIDVLSVVCSSDGKQASIFGTATVNGSGTFNYRIDLKDLAEPGSTDTYRIRLSNGYDSDEQVLEGGNVQIH